MSKIKPNSDLVAITGSQNEDKRLSKENEKLLELSKVLKEEVPKSLEQLTIIERLFIQRYVANGNKQKSFKETYESLGLTYPQKLEDREILINNMLMKSTVKMAEKDLRSVFISEYNNLFAETGVEVALDFKKIVDDKESLKRINKRIERYDSLIADAVAMHDIGLERQLMNEQLSFEKSKDRLIESIRKNAATVNAIVGDSKQKQVIKAGAININVGNTGNNMKTIDIIENDPIEAIDITELENNG